MSEAVAEEEKTVTEAVSKEAVEAINSEDNSEAVVDDTALTVELCTPISDSEPCGEDPKYNHEFEVIKGEIAKPGARDFEVVAQNCHIVLTKQAKDITTFSYYILASAMDNGIEDFCSVIIAFSRQLSEHWETIHPTRERARMNSISWLNEERTLGMLEKVEVSEANHSLLLSAKDALESIKTLTFEKFPDSPPSIKGLVQRVEKWVKSTKPQEIKADAPAPTATTSSAAAPSSQGSTPMADMGSKTDAQKNLQKIAIFLSAQENSNPLGYKLLRMVKWQELQSEPKAEAGKTLFAPPIAQRVSFYQNLVQQQNWDGVIEKSETVFTEPGLHFWFDLQHYVCQALTAKGGTYAQCATAIKTELVGLLSRVPTLKDLKYKDDTPFASSQTKEWLDEIASEVGGGSSTPSQVSTKKSADLETDMVTAEEMLGKGKFEDALFLIQSGCAYGSLKEVCERKTVMARMCYQNNQHFIADSLLSELDEEIQKRSLVEWDSDFCIEVWTQHIKVLSTITEMSTVDVADKEAIKIRLRNTYKRLSNVNPLSATKLNFV
ncbi:MAG: type VI secretion system protein TssA [Fibrobacterales bacterium]